MNKISRTLKIVLTVVFLHGLVDLPAFANETGPWKVARVAGDTLVQKPGSDWQKVTIGEMVSVGHRLRTGRSGELILARDDERVTMTPNSVLELQAGGGNLATRLFQKAGTMMFKVRKKVRKHFEVRTPYLVAVVKGTQFTVTVHDQGGAVHVTEGLVEVADIGAQNKVMVHPGKTASVASTKGSKVQLGVTPPAARKKGPGKQSKAPKLMQPIGIAKVNITKRSKGLLKRRGNPAEAQTASRVSGKPGNPTKSNSGNGNAFGNPFDKSASNGLGNAFGHSNGNNAGGNGNGNGNGNGGGNGIGNGVGGGHGNGNGNNGNGNNGNGNGNNGNGKGKAKAKGKK